MNLNKLKAGAAGLAASTKGRGRVFADKRRKVDTSSDEIAEAIEDRLPTVEAVASKFSELLRKELGADKMATVLERNSAETSEGVCHSHDFCDANVIMCEAFSELGVSEDAAIYDDRVAKLWNAAWDMAVKNGFAASGAKTPSGVC
jgi:hypothetical protein